jgi:hypothetical protein
MTNCLKINKRQNWVDHLLQQNHLTSTKQYNEKRMKQNGKKTAYKYSTIETGGITKRDLRNNHQSKQSLEEPKQRKVHGTKILLPKQLSTKLVKKGIALVQLEFFLIWKKNSKLSIGR